jgi:molecular chaperone GrpE
MADDLNEKVEAAKAEDQAKQQAQKDEDSKDAKIEELTGQLARAMADLQNFKRRSEEEKASFVKFANSEMLKTILPILDNLDRSVTHLPDELKDNEWTKGMLQIHDDLIKTFEKLGIKKIKTVGEKLDPNLHEAMLAGPGDKDVIVEEFEPGYTLQDDVIKVAKVKVGDGSKK